MSKFLDGIFANAKDQAGNILGGLPSSVFTFGTSVLGNLVSGSMQRHYQKDLMDYQSKLQKDMMQYSWNNQYGAQVQGMKGAGLNPSLMQGGSFGLNSAPSVSGGSASALPVEKLSVKDMADLSMMSSQKANLDADTRLKNSQAGSNEKDAEYKQWEIDLFERTFNDHVNEIHSRNFKDMSEGRKNEKMIDLYDQTIENLKEEWKLINQQAIREGKINDNFEKSLKAQIDALISEYNLNNVQAESVRKLSRAYDTYYQALTRYTIAKKNQVQMDTALDENYKTALASLLRAQEDFIESQQEFMPMNEIGGLMTRTATAAGVAAGGVGTFRAAQKYGGKALGGAAGSSVRVKGLGD